MRDVDRGGRLDFWSHELAQDLVVLSYGQIHRLLNPPNCLPTVSQHANDSIDWQSRQVVVGQALSLCKIHFLLS